jgi:2-polyprenyl-6-methoxyphenol hydroxylase-like FAD-dependent oxidoreductase
MPTDHDAIVVGARCAGSPTAMLLARKGYRVLLVDRASFPSDTLSTLVIHAPGVAALRRWGLLETVTASGCPPIDTYSFDFGPFVIAGTPHPDGGGSTAYAPRRTVLDKVLVDAAAAAGAEVRERFTVEELVIEDGRVVGIRGHGEGGASVVERASVVIGADGRNSRVARAVEPEQYNDKPVLEHAFYTFWSDLPADGFQTVLRDDRGFAVIPTNDDLTLVLVGCPFAQAKAFREDVEGNYFAALDRAPEFAARVRAATREEPFTGGGVPNFFRTPYGPGWALVGDAGYTKDPVTAQGISDAFRDAELCAGALDEALTGRRSFDDAMADYQRIRDTRALPIYEFTTHLATFEPPPPEMQALLAAVHGNQTAMDEFVSVTAGTMSPEEFLAPDHVADIMAAAATPPLATA